MLVTDENKVSNFTPGSLQGKFLAETNIDEKKDVDNMFPQLAAVTLNKTRFEKQQFPTFKSNEASWANHQVIFRHSLLKKLNSID